MLRHDPPPPPPLLTTQDVLLRAGKSHPLYARVLEAAPPMALVLPASGLQLPPTPAPTPGSSSSSSSTPPQHHSTSPLTECYSRAGEPPQQLRVALRAGDMSWWGLLQLQAHTQAEGEEHGQGRSPGVPRCSGFEPVIMEGDATSNILFSSGTTVRAGAGRGAGVCVYVCVAVRVGSRRGAGVCMCV